MFGFNFFKNRSYLRKSKDCFDEGDYDSALELFNKVIINDSKNWNGLVGKIWCLVELDSVDEAMDVCKDILSFYPENPSAYLFYASILGDCVKDYSNALKFYNKSLDIEKLLKHWKLKKF